MMAQIMTEFSALLILFLLFNYVNGAKKWEPPEDEFAQVVVNKDDGLETIQFRSETEGIWEIGNGEIWKMGANGQPINVTDEYDPIPWEFITNKKKELKRKKEEELKGGSIRTNQSDSHKSMRPATAGGKKKPATGSIRTKSKTAGGSIRTAGGNKVGGSASSSSGSFRTPIMGINSRIVDPMPTIVEKGRSVEFNGKNYVVVNINKEADNLYSIKKDKPVGDKTVRQIQKLDIDKKKRN